MAIDLNRTTMQLPAELSDEILGAAVKGSAVMQLARQVALPGSGKSIPVITSDSTAAWTDETNEKQVSNPALGVKTMKPYKLACIELFSEELLRDMPALYDELVRRAPAAIAKTFDATVLHGSAPGTGFDTLADAAIITNEDAYAAYLDAMSTIGAAGGQMDGVAISAQGKAQLFKVMGNGAPVFVDPATGSVAGVLGARLADTQEAAAAGAVATAGDWSLARFGIVDGIRISVSRDATVTTGGEDINLWQRNMVGIRIEAELGFIVANKAAFARIGE